jgi:ribosome-associated toxin RatA of RatAB toxin-antitoxin module
VPSVSKSVLLPFSTEQMYALVDAIDLYPEFLPWCSAASVLSRSAESAEAVIEMNFRGIRQRFTTVNTNQPPVLIELNLKDGPFSSLTGQWRFLQLGDLGCKVSFELQYEFSSRAIAAVIGAAFDRIANSLLDAFVTRADDIYGGNVQAAA